MIRIYADFNDQTADGGYWILQSDDAPIEEKITEIGLSSGDRVLLYQDDDDFEVEASLYYKFVDTIGREGWVAYPDWNTLSRKPPKQNTMKTAGSLTNRGTRKPAGQSWKSDRDLKTKAGAFFEAARAAVWRDPATLSTLIAESRFRSMKGLVFDVDDVVQRAEHELVVRCIKLLGPRAGHEREIAALAWEHVWQSLAGATPSSEIGVITEGFVSELLDHAQLRFEYVTPNYAVRFQGQARKINIGPVEAILSEELLPELLKDKKNPHWDVIVGPEFRMLHTPVGFTFQLSPISWRITVAAAQGNVEEEAAWLVNIALGFLRLCYPAGQYDFFPSVGEPETMPFIKPEGVKQGLTITGDGISCGSSLPNFYLIDDTIVAIANTDEFQSRANAIFNPANRSLAERLSQGLGWLTRGRQTVDRAERFLFFFTAMEALLSGDDKDSPVVQTIARHATVILQRDPEKRAQLASSIKSLYAARSALVHAGKRNVSRQDVDAIQHIAEELYKIVIEAIPMETPFTAFQKSLSDSSYGLPWPPAKV